MVRYLKKNYKIAMDWTGGLNCGITLQWDYEQHTLDFSMPGYIKNNCKNTSMKNLPNHIILPTHWTPRNIEKQLIISSLKTNPP